MPVQSLPVSAGTQDERVQTIGKYQVVRVLGHGGMGTVYEAVDPLLKRKVALKTMIPELAETAELRARFLREAQAAGGLRHRNIVTVYDLGEDKGQPYIAMELLEGTDLDKIIQNKEPYPPEWKLDVLGQICEGLSFAHKNGIVHRDVKPANIRITPEGDVKIVDFGIAHLQSSNLTKSGLVLGTVHYMSPEQIDGQKVDHRADIFSVGAIAYELFCHRKPFDGESITGVMFKIMHERADLGALPPTEYSPGLEKIIARALARDVGARYQSLDDMHTDLGKLVKETAPRVMAETVTLEAKVAGETQSRRERAQGFLRRGREAMAEGNLVRARECADEVLLLFPDDAGARALMLEVDSESLRRRVERETADIRAEMDEARAAGQLQRALSLCQRLLDVDPDDGALRATEAEIQSAIHEKEVEQLSSQALAYAADGDVELALKIAARVERIAPESAAAAELRGYLEGEARRAQARAFTAAAQDHLAEGELEEARAAAERALEADPQDALAREIRDRAAEVLARRAPAPPPPAPAPPPPVEVPVAAAAPAPVSAPAPMAAAAPVAPPAPVAAPAARRAAASPERLDAVLSQIVSATKTPVPKAAPPEAGGDRKSDAEALTTAALDHFVKNEYGKARRAVEKALALEPQNKKARELHKILGALG
jgi:tetratricopeptide (TPR) repeat protein/tRNA A-37 threonylcarbamoyl transferase component Bud32